ncbi:recombinase family protein [Thermomonas mangrovi]|uniref:recombinase family protein n=1 Tax=Thermomonas mangrovi TaxID=2993316 RepID=UPI003CE59D27
MRVAAYARYSSDQQRDASLDDQLRNCRAYCVRAGWPEPVAYTDAAMSGARNDRPGYLRLLSDATRFDVIVVDDLSRLSRDSVEAQQAVKRLRFAGVRVIGVSDGLDTGRKGHKAEVGLRGLMGELYLDDLRDKTHRGLAGRALAGASAGGLPYGYRVTERGQRAIRDEQAAVVRRVFADYLSGQSARAIAVALNAEGVPSPRGSTWAVSAIYGDTKRGIGILANPIYVGRQVWNRSQWIKHPDTGRRIRRERPSSEWVTVEHPDLAIVDARTWDAVQAAMKRRGHAAGNRGRAPRSLLAGLLRCGQCGGPITMVDAHSYGCSTAKNRGTCTNRIRVKARDADAAMVAGVRDALLTDEAMKAWQQAIARHMKAQAGSGDDARRKLAKAQSERDNLLNAIRAGIITPSTKAALEAAEADVIAAQRATQQPARIMPDVRDRLRRIADTLADRARQVPAAREALRALIGEATLRNENGDLVAEIAGSHLSMVAGAGFEPATFGL